MQWTVRLFPVALLVVSFFSFWCFFVVVVGGPVVGGPVAFV